MFRLVDILREVLEGAKVTFDDKGTATDIEIAYRHLDGEQLKTDDGVNKREGYQVFYSLSSDPKAENVKSSEDALKYNSDKIKKNQLRDLLVHTVYTRIPKVDYIAYLGSEGGLNKILVDVLKSLYGDAEVVLIDKMEYNFIDNAVDWDSFRDQTSRVQKAVLDYLDKTASSSAPPYKIRKTGKTQSLVISQLYSKYNIGLHPSGEGEKFPAVYNAISDCLLKGKTMLIVDDNTYTGTDFRKIFEGIERIKEHIIKANETPIGKEAEALKDLDKIRAHSSFKKSEFLQKKAAEYEEELKRYRERVSILNSSLNKSRDRFFGYVLYLLQGSDLKK